MLAKRDPYPHKIQKCLDSWKKHLPDYEVMLWDCNQFDLKSSLWVEQAFCNQNMLLRQITSACMLSITTEVSISTPT